MHTLPGEPHRSPCSGGQRTQWGAGGPGSDHPRPSQLDALIHRFITLLADTSDSRAAENRVADANMACRKLAVAHPILLLRYRLACPTCNLSGQSSPAGCPPRPSLERLPHQAFL